MFEKVRVQGYRQFSDLTVAPLSRVNVFVGKNNCGKSTLLEVVELLTATGSQTLLGICERRSEFPLSERRDQLHGRLVNVEGLFQAIDDGPSALFELNAEGSTQQKLEVALARLEEKSSIIVVENGEEIERIDSSVGLFLDLRAQGKLVWRRKIRVDEELTVSLRVPPPRGLEPALSSYVGTQRSDAGLLSRLWDDVVLAGREELVIDCLRIVNPAISKLHFTRQAYERGSGGIAIIERGRNKPIPLGSLGDGAKHLLTLSIHLAAATGGVLLVDEIDTGLHYTILRQIWEILLRASRDIPIQIFATTHSWDCIRALSDAASSIGARDDVCLHRIEKDKTVFYDSKSLCLSAAEEVEVR